jgi:hypothetical protein
MQVRYTPTRRTRRRESSPIGALVAIVLILSLAGCAALGAEPMIALIGSAIPARSPQPSAPVAAQAAQHTPALPVATGLFDPTLAPTVVPTHVPTPSVTRKPRPTPKPTPRLKPRPQPGPFEIDLYRSGQFLHQMEDYWCTAAAMQVMINIMDRGRDTSRRTQARLYQMGHRNSTSRLDGKGIEPEGTDRTLEQLGFGQWSIAISKGRYWAIRTAVKALRNTNRPVAMITWHGAHTWVISGFKATADPAYTSRFEVTGLYIEDVWWPTVSSIWGASNPPDTFVPVEKLAEDYLPFNRWTVNYPGKDGNFLMIIPETRASR